MHNFSTQYPDGKQIHGAITAPNICPICHRGMDAAPINFVGRGTEDNRQVQAVFRCAFKDCYSVFIATYETNNTNASPSKFISVAPTVPISRNFSETIAKSSPSFVEIYKQASLAEQFELGQIAGVGFRKALEFLIKDYAIELDQSKDQIIKETPLGKVIKDYIDNQQVKECAEMATWLGNDETHYTRKWVDQDLSDLKLLIDLTVQWIELVKMTEKYKVAMKKTGTNSATTTT